jgi:hypothetical protein
MVAQLASLLLSHPCTAGISPLSRKDSVARCVVQSPVDRPINPQQLLVQGRGAGTTRIQES